MKKISRNPSEKLSSGSNSFSVMFLASFVMLAVRIALLKDVLQPLQSFINPGGILIQKKIFPIFYLRFLPLQAIRRQLQ